MRTYQRIEKDIFKQGIRYLAGTDEAGRGPLAGPVVAAAVIFPRNVSISGVTDSKKLTWEQRLILSEKIKQNALCYSYGVVSHFTIDRINILQASLLAMQKAINGLEIRPEFILIDGNKNFDSEIKTKTIIDGDLKCFTVASASILAKVYRDKLMEEYAKLYPQYHLEQNKGYATPEHINAILKYGHCEIHRKKFLRKIYGRREFQAKFEF